MIDIYPTVPYIYSATVAQEHIMQFRPQGNRVQVLAYRGYDKEKKRAQVKLLGSFDRYGHVLSKNLWYILTEAERVELSSYIEKLRESYDEKMRIYGIESLASQIQNVSYSLNTKESVSKADRQFADEVYEAIDNLTKRLRGMGFRRPVKPRAKPVAAHADSNAETGNLL